MEYGTYIQDKDLLKYYIIRDVNTREHLPISKQRNKTSSNFTSILPPRLFKRLTDAKNCLNFWREGEWFSYYDTTIGGKVLKVEEIKQRKDRNIEIIEVYIVQGNIYATI